MSSSSTHIFFASDFHLGAAADTTHDRELKVVRWLTEVGEVATEIYLVGDLFDFWFEYKSVVPKGHVRLLGKLAELADRGVKLHIFTGNHDVWMFDYFTREFGAKMYYQPVRRTIDGKEFMIGHGDGLGPGDSGYKFIKKIFTNPMCQRLFAALHPYFGAKLARFFSRKSRETTGDKDSIYLGDDKEFLVQYCNEVLESEHVDYFIFGHRHMVLDKILKGGSRYINLGEWFSQCNYAHFDGEELRLIQFEG
ncbi:MAG TPA: UDP-2,3-diacylglucosamine hydrolase [Flavobacteriales bacterium]|jgi:UDP-2,3-diacylglucosamine hydrolase|nr:UDP-2,3-diacylglucosamine diphosphatase [Flavobacteriales bacterium]HAW19289.1 UDP-2,3-diacylglucosamine hydrolase [Flavobacteriales bacterium]